MFLVGKIVGVFGIKGELKILPLISPADSLLAFDSIFIENEDSIKKEFKILRAKQHKNVYLFTFENIDSVSIAENLIGLSMYVPKLDFIELKGNEYYYHDLEGLTAYNQYGELIGKVDHILKGGNDILLIKSETGIEIMIPFVDELVPEINLEEKTVTINVIDGLI